METGHLQIPLSQADYKYSFFDFFGNNSLFVSSLNMRETTKKSLIPSIWNCAKAFACICGIMAFMTRVIGVEAEALKWHISTTEDWQAFIADTEGFTITENHAVAEKPEVSFTSRKGGFSCP